MVTALLLLLPAVIVLVWRHGRPGDDRWTKVDAAVIVLNLVAAGGFLMIGFSGDELGAVTTVQTVENLEGNPVELAVPNAAFRRRLLLYEFDNESGDTDLGWLSFGLSAAIEIELVQDRFLTVVNTRGVGELLAEAGYQETRPVPLSLKREIAERRNLAHFIEGSFLKDGDTLVVETRLYETRNARLASKREYRGLDPLEISDRMSVDLRQDLGIPDWQIEESIDLPAAELLTESPEAYRLASEAMRFFGFGSTDLASARVLAKEAAALDSTFAGAFWLISNIEILMGDRQAAAEALASLSLHAYRLPERMQLSMQVIDQLHIQLDPDAALQTARYWTEVYPDDIQARQLLAALYGQTGDAEARIEQHRAILVLDPEHIESLRSVALAFRTDRQYDSALVLFRRLRDRQPTEVQGYLDVALTLRFLGRYEQERAELERARVVAPDDPEVVHRLARLDMRFGLYDDAEQRVQTVVSLARTTLERETAAGVEETLYYRRGQFTLLEGAYWRRLAARSEASSPIAVVNSMGASEIIFAAAEGGRESFALAQVDSLKSTVDAPFNQTIDWRAVRLHLDMGNLEASRTSLAAIRSYGEARGTTGAREPYYGWVEGRIAELEDGNCERALVSYEAALEATPRSSLYAFWKARCLRQLEEWDEAETLIADIVARDPGNGNYRLEAARNYAAWGRDAEAIEQLTVALDYWSEADSGFIPAQEARAMMEELRTP